MAGPSYLAERAGTLPVGSGEARAWLQRPGAFERLLPPWERAEVVQGLGGTDDGTRVVFRLKGPVPIRCVARPRVEPGGPTSRWIDGIEVEPPLGGLGGARGMELLVKSRVERMLAYRHAVLPEDLAAHHVFRHRARLRVAVTGASGLLGSALVPFLTSGGHSVLSVTRRPRRQGDVGWDPASGRLDPWALDNIHAAVHLAGETIAVRWTAERKRKIRESRLKGTRLLAETLARLAHPPRVLVSASGIGIYGSRGDTTLTEETPSLAGRGDFLVELAREWEAATEPARAAGIRVVLLRFGAILTPAGGALGRMLLPFRLGVGGPLGSGRHWASWIAIDDAVGAVHHGLMVEDLAGPVNAVAPEPVTWRVLADTLGRVLHRPALIPAPALALRLAFGEMARTALLASQRALPARLQASGYRFRLPALEPALRHLLGR